MSTRESAAIWILPTSTKPIKFADYTFVIPEIKVNEFKMLPDEVSDHLAMYLDFE